MRANFIISLLALFFIGCYSTQHEDSFSSLQRNVQQKLADTCNCGPVTSNTVAGCRFFIVKPRNSFYGISVREREFMNRRHREQQHTYLTNQVAEFLTKTHWTQTDISRHLSTIKQLLKLPEWTYDSTGIDVYLETPEVSYPNLEKDTIKAQKCYDEIIKLLKPIQSD